MYALESAPLVREDSDGDFIEEEIAEVQRTARSKSFMRTVAAILVIGAVAAVVVTGPIDNPLHADMGEVQQLDEADKAYQYFVEPRRGQPCSKGVQVDKGDKECMLGACGAAKRGGACVNLRNYDGSSLKDWGHEGQAFHGHVPGCFASRPPGGMIFSNLAGTIPDLHPECKAPYNGKECIGHAVCKVEATTLTTTTTKNAKQVAQEAAADKAAKQAAADKAVADASTSLRTDLAKLTSTKGKFQKELQTLETDIAATETAAQAVKNMAKNAADEMVVANKAVQKAHEEAIIAKDDEHKILAAKHKAAADKLLKTAKGHKADADKAKKALEGHQKNAKDAEVKRKKQAATKDKEALTVAQALVNKTQDAANLAKEAAAKAKGKAALTKAAADVAAR